MPPGEFPMGSDESMAELEQAVGRLPDEFNNADEHPRHLVRLTKPVLIGACEVTVGQFRRFVEESQYRTDAERDGMGGWGWLRGKQVKFRQKPEFTWRRFGPLEPKPDFPVVNVSWNDAMAFCRWLSEREGKRYRLPTEAEWEYACRAGTTTRFFHGDDPERLAQMGNVADATARRFFPHWRNALKADDGHAAMTTVGCFTPNAFRLYDMHGNVAEWCSDWYDPEFYAHSPTNDPQGPPAGTQKVFRGGGWHADAVDCRSASRDRAEPSNRYDRLGFRVLCEFPDVLGKANANPVTTGGRPGKPPAQSDAAAASATSDSVPPAGPDKNGRG